MASFDELRMFAQDTYGQHGDLTQDFPGWALNPINEKDYTTESNGFGGATYIKTEVGKVIEVVIAYRGTELPKDLPDLTTDIQIALTSPDFWYHGKVENLDHITARRESLGFAEFQRAANSRGVA